MKSLLLLPVVVTLGCGDISVLAPTRSAPTASAAVLTSASRPELMPWPHTRPPITLLPEKPPVAAPDPVPDPVPPDLVPAPPAPPPTDPPPCPADTVPVLREAGLTCEPRPEDRQCPTGTHPVLQDTLICVPD